MEESLGTWGPPPPTLSDWRKGVRGLEAKKGTGEKREGGPMETTYLNAWHRWGGIWRDQHDWNQKEDEDESCEEEEHTEDQEVEDETCDDEDVDNDGESHDE